jgi:hypothetical protein
MKKTANSTKRQLKFMILLTLLDDEEYASSGINVHNLQASLLENKPLWFKVGKVSDEKLWGIRLSGELSDLDRGDFALRRSELGKYYKGKKFDEVLQKLVEELSEDLELDITVDERMLSGKMSVRQIIRGIDDLSIPYQFLSFDKETKKNFLTIEQGKRLAQLSVQFDCY